MSLKFLEIYLVVFLAILFLKELGHIFCTALHIMYLTHYILTFFLKLLSCVLGHTWHALGFGESHSWWGLGAT